MKWAVEKLLKKSGECSAAADINDRYWCFCIRLYDPNSSTAWVERLRAFFRGKEVPPATVMKVTERRGPLVLRVYGKISLTAALAWVNPRTAVAASADVFIKTTRGLRDYSGLVAGLREAISGMARVTHSINAGRYASIDLRVPKIRNLIACMEIVQERLRSHAVPRGSTLTICTETKAVSTPVYGDLSSEGRPVASSNRRRAVAKIEQDPRMRRRPTTC